MFVECLVVWAVDGISISPVLDIDGIAVRIIVGIVTGKVRIANEVLPHRSVAIAVAEVRDVRRSAVGVVTSRNAGQVTAEGVAVVVDHAAIDG